MTRDTEWGISLPFHETAGRSVYQSLVDERRARQSLGEEVTNLRADSLCVCPINLKEQ
ncbi:MAG: hypothetical protein HYY17_07375 [Planctomycetes bacterium]|nr:hypothetical protein [Planctomycetota bacterium]